MIKKTVTALSVAVLSAGIGTLPIATSFAGTPGQVSADDPRATLNPCAAVNPCTAAKPRAWVNPCAARV